MTCTCSRQRHKTENSGRLNVALHCLSNGSFEKLQCDFNICWCADENDGHILMGTVAVPQSLWRFLPCCKLYLNRLDFKITDTNQGAYTSILFQ